MYGMARLLNDKRPIVLISLIIIIIKFISYAKLQSLLYVFLGLMLYSPKKYLLQKEVVLRFLPSYFFGYENY